MTVMRYSNIHKRFAHLSIFVSLHQNLLVPNWLKKRINNVSNNICLINYLQVLHLVLPSIKCAQIFSWVSLGWLSFSLALLKTRKIESRWSCLLLLRLKLLLHFQRRVFKCICVGGGLRLAGGFILLWESLQRNLCREMHSFKNVLCICSQRNSR